MPRNAAARSPEPDDLRPREYPRLVPPGDEADPPTQGEPRLSPPGAVPPGAVASAELPWEQPRVHGIRPPPLTAPHWRLLHVSAGGACVLFLLQIILLWIWLLTAAL